ncbi:Thioredoxin-like 4A [Friedmanniomyces endolithicus]|nr:Thioredoxin-like 4A [Friedmanniomyces endolithicus]KAK1821239.1 Thioredoxin-like 4A [Friedmanniomyces endolithicus]
MGSVVIPHLVTGWHVDQAIMSEEDRLVVIRFGRDWDPDCMRQDEVLYKIADRVKNFAVIYVCDIDQVPDFKQMYELYDTVTLMFFFRNKHMMCDFGTGNNNKLNWVLEDKQELIDIVETIYKVRAHGMIEHIISDLGENARDDEAMKAFGVTGGVYGWSPNLRAIPYKLRWLMGRPLPRVQRPSQVSDLVLVCV